MGDALVVFVLRIAKKLFARNTGINLCLKNLHNPRGKTACGEVREKRRVWLGGAIEGIGSWGE